MSIPAESSPSVADVRAVGLSLPATTVEPHHEYSSLRVLGRIFATWPPAGETVHVFVAPERINAIVSANPGVCEVLMWGKRALGVRVMLGRAGHSLLRELLTEAWKRKAPRRIVTAFESNRD